MLRRGVFAVDEVYRIRVNDTVVRTVDLKVVRDKIDWPLWHKGMLTTLWRVAKCSTTSSILLLTTATDWTLTTATTGAKVRCGLLLSDVPVLLATATATDVHMVLLHLSGVLGLSVPLVTLALAT